MTQTYPIRAIDPAQATAFFAVSDQAFNARWPPDKALEHELIAFEFDRSAAAFDGHQIVGSSCAYTYQLSVPGGMVAAGGISAVAVLPTYRRRGIMSAMIRHVMADIAAHGEPIAALFASEPEIYGRFGFGCATEHLALTVPRGDARLIPPSVPSGRPGPPRLRIVEPERALPELDAVYQAVAQRRPGITSRDERWWRAYTDDPDWARDGASPTRWMVAEDDAGPRGYAAYSVRPDWNNDGNAAGKLDVHELMATDPEAAAALWTDLLTRDLVSEVQAWLRPADEELLYLLAGRRRARALLRDGLWIRLIDLPAALSQRRYSRELDVVVEVTDELLPGNAGRWRLRADAKGEGTCERTTQAPDLLLPVQALGAGYLGGARLGALAAAGQVAQERPGALAELSAAMSWDPAPWCPQIF